MRNQSASRIAAAVFASCVVVSCLGCQTTSPGAIAATKPKPKLHMPWSKKTEPRTGNPERVVGTWTEAVLHNSETGATRGFGGRLYFYDRESTEPIRVEGQLVVYAFDEDDRSPADNKPTRRFVFPPEQFVLHESESEIGASYSFWLPWDAAGGQETDVSLIARFEPIQGGGLVVSEQTRHRLPGSERADAMLAHNSGGFRVQQASASGGENQAATQAVFEDFAEQEKQQMTATTISLPARFQPGVRKQKPAQSVKKPPADMPQSSSIETTLTPDQLQPTPSSTRVSYLTPGESVRQSLRQRSFGSSPAQLQAPATPASPPPFGPTH